MAKATGRKRRVRGGKRSRPLSSRSVKIGGKRFTIRVNLKRKRRTRR